MIPNAFTTYQMEAMRTRGIFADERDQTIAALLGIGGETGELLDLFKKCYYHNKHFDPESAQKELGDVLWYIALLCDAQGWDLSEIASKNVTKLRLRYPDGFSYAAANARRS